MTVGCLQMGSFQVAKDRSHRTCHCQYSLLLTKRAASRPDALVHKVQMPWAIALILHLCMAYLHRSIQVTPVQSSITIQSHFISGKMSLDLQNNTLMKSKEGHPQICAP